MEKFKLGDKVSYSKIMVKFKGEYKSIWQDFIVDGEPYKGIIIGIRFVKDVKFNWSEDGCEFQQIKTHKVYLVASSLYHKHSFVPVDGIKIISE